MLAHYKSYELERESDNFLPFCGCALERNFLTEFFRMNK